MMPRERAIELIETIDNAGWGCLPLDAIIVIEQAIATAIEEGRKSRECCKAEREALLKIAEEEKGKPDAPYRDFSEGYLAALDFMIHQIRARSDS